MTLNTIFESLNINTFMVHYFLNDNSQDPALNIFTTTSLPLTQIIFHQSIFMAISQV